MNKINESKLDRTAFSIESLYSEQNDLQYWLKRTPQDRLEALELTRQILYGYDPSSTRLQRILEITELK